MRGIETIDAELRLLCRAWCVAREFGCSPSTVQIDALLDERLAAITARSKMELPAVTRGNWD
jgi:hypothetical protein